MAAVRGRKMPDEEIAMRKGLQAAYYQTPQGQEHLAKLRQGSYRAVRCIELNCIYASIKEAAAAMDVHSSSISHAIAKQGTCRGYHWEYEDDA